MNSSQCTSMRSPSQWQNFWPGDLDAEVIDAQIAHMWQGKPLRAVVVGKYRPKVYCIRVESRRELRMFFERFDRWSHDLWYWDSAGKYSRIPGSIDHRLMDCLVWHKPRMTVDDWHMVVCRPAENWLALARKYRVAIAMKVPPPIHNGRYDRSAGIWWLCCMMKSAGASAAEIVAVVEHSKPFVMKRETHGDRWAKAELKRLYAKLRRAKR